MAYISSIVFDDERSCVVGKIVLGSGHGGGKAQGRMM
jgi:hypothetical protein